MTTTVAVSAPGPEPQGSPVPRVSTEDQPQSGVGESQAQDAAELRLVIEEDKPSGSYVYKTVDARTGKVVQQFPREEVLRMRDAPGYAPGSLLNTRG